LQAELASYGIARGNLKLATTHASASLQQAEQILARKHMAWAHKLQGDIAILEERVEEAQREYAAALAILQCHPCPLIEWKILKAAAEAAKRQKNDAASDEFRGRSLAVVQSLARSIHDDKLRQQFLAAKAVRDLSSCGLS
jgi:hypothetical protein